MTSSCSTSLSPLGIVSLFNLAILLGGRHGFESPGLSLYHPLPSPPLQACPRWRCARNTTGCPHPLEPLDLFYASTQETLWSSLRLKPNRTGGRYRLGPWQWRGRTWTWGQGVGGLGNGIMLPLDSGNGNLLRAGWCLWGFLGLTWPFWAGGISRSWYWLAPLWVIPGHGEIDSQAEWLLGERWIHTSRVAACNLSVHLSLPSF